MDKKHSIVYLLTLKDTINDLMGSSLMGNRYTKALKAGIESLSSDDIEVTSNKFVIKVVNDKGNLYVKVFLKKGGWLETHEYLAQDLIDENMLGES